MLSNCGAGTSLVVQCRRPRFNPWVGKIPWKRKWQSTPVPLPGKIPWTEEPSRLQSMGSQRVGHDWATSLSLSCNFISNCPLKIFIFPNYLPISLNLYFKIYFYLSHIGEEWPTLTLSTLPLLFVCAIVVGINLYFLWGLICCPSSHCMCRKSGPPVHILRLPILKLRNFLIQYLIQSSPYPSFSRGSSPPRDWT